MKLADQWRRAGHRLFRWRSYVPLLFAPAFLLVYHLDRRPFASSGRLLAWQLFCLAVALAGIAIRAHVVGHAAAGTSGRNQAAQKADDLNITGWYSIVRHPLYLGNFVSLLGLSLLPAAWYLPVIVAFGTALYYERIMLIEEEFLEEKFGDAFRRWADATPAIIPAVGRWRAPSLPMEWRVVLRAEIYGVFQIVVAVFVLDILQRDSLHHARPLSPLWTAVVAVTAVLWLAARYARKHTRLLDTPDR